jgi:hypothetical protein
MSLFKPPVNVGPHERYAAGILGAALLVEVLRRPRFWPAFGAACLFYRAVSGNCKGYEWTGVSTCPLKDKR